MLPPGGSSTQPSKWVTKEEFLQSAISTAMKKVFKAFEASQGKQKDSKTKVSGTVLYTIDLQSNNLKVSKKRKKDMSFLFFLTLTHSHLEHTHTLTYIKLPRG